LKKTNTTNQEVAYEEVGEVSMLCIGTYSCDLVAYYRLFVRISGNAIRIACP